MKRRLTRLLVLVAVAVLTYLMVLGVHCLFGGGVPVLAKRLPEDTLAWAHYEEMDGLVKNLRNEGFFESVLVFLAEEPRFARLVWDAFDEEVDEGTADRLLDWLAEIRSVDVVFQGVTISRGKPVPELAVVFDFGSARAVRNTLAGLERLFGREGEHEDYAIYELADKFAGRLDRTGLLPCLAVKGERIVLAMDSGTLADMVDILVHGEKSCLAKNEAFRRLPRAIEG